VRQGNRHTGGRMKTVLQILQEARALIAKGWTQGTYYTPDKSKFCLVGALSEASGPLDTHTLATDVRIQAYRKAAEAVAKGLMVDSTPGEHDEFYIGLVPFNDQPGRTKDEVLALIDKAINAELQ